VDLKVAKFHQVKVNEHGESEWNTCSCSSSGLLHRVNTFVINFNLLYYSSNKLFNVQKLPSYFSNVQCDDMWSKALCLGRMGAWMDLA